MLEAGNLGADDVRVLARGGHRLEMLFQSVESRLEGGERIANFVRDTGGQRAERGEFLLPFKQGLAAHQFRSQRRDGVTVDYPAYRRNQGQQQDDAGDENSPETSKRSRGVGK